MRNSAIVIIVSAILSGNALGQPSASASKIDFCAATCGRFLPIIAGRATAPTEAAARWTCGLIAATTPSAPLKNGKRRDRAGQRRRKRVSSRRIGHEKRIAAHAAAGIQEAAQRRRRRNMLKRWIAEGAEYSRALGLRPAAARPKHRRQESSWPINADRSLHLAPLEKEGSAPSPPANKDTLLARA